MIDQPMLTRLSALLAPIANLSIRREIVMVLLILAETMIVFVFAGTLLAEHESPFTPLPVLLIFTILLVAYQIPHLLETIRLWTPEYEIVMVTGLLTSMLIVIKVGAFPHEPLLSSGWLEGTVNALILRENESIRPVWMLVIFTVYAWWRGRMRAEPVLETSYSMLRLGIVWIAGGLVLNVLATSPDAAIYQHINAAVIGFLIFSLLAVAVSRQPASENAPEWNAAWIWLMVFVLPILAIAATTISTVGVLTRDTLDLFLAILSPVFWLLGLLIRIMILVIAVTAFILMSPLIWFLERQGFGPFSEFPAINLAPRSVSDIEGFAQNTLDIADPIRYLIVGVVLTLVTWALVKFTFRRRRRWQEGSRLQRESLIEWEEPASRLLGRAVRWLSGRARATLQSDDPTGPEWSATRRVRRSYRSFLRFNRRHDLQRGRGETPDQFARRLTSQNLRLKPEVDQITGSYNQARYSGKPVGKVVAERAESALSAYQREIDRQPETE